jgi:hypothetical protein
MWAGRRCLSLAEPHSTRLIKRTTTARLPNQRDEDRQYPRQLNVQATYMGAFSESTKCPSRASLGLDTDGVMHSPRLAKTALHFRHQPFSAEGLVQDAARRSNAQVGERSSGIPRHENHRQARIR